MNVNCPVAETSESIEPNDNDLELNAIAYTFSKIESNLNFNTEYARSFGDGELLAFSSEANGETEKKNTFSAVEDSTLLRWHSGTQKRVGRTKKDDQIDNETRLFWKGIAKTKHQRLTSLSPIRLVPGADRVVRHICIRCIGRETFEHRSPTWNEYTNHVLKLLSECPKKKKTFAYYNATRLAEKTPATFSSNQK